MSPFHTFLGAPLWMAEASPGQAGAKRKSQGTLWNAWKLKAKEYDFHAALY